jgi:uncharacterized membrane protein
MNATQVHLAMTHLPVILSLAGMITLLISFLKPNVSLRKTALYILLIAGLTAFPVFLTGEGAEETVENMPGISESLIEEHESMAKYGLFAILAAAVLALISLPNFIAEKFKKGIVVAVLIVSFVSTGLMIQTAHLGGQIRHSEIRTGITQQGDNAENEDDD